MRRLAVWLESNEVEQPTQVDSIKAVTLACNNEGEWKGLALFIYEKSGFTVFSDLTGQLGSRDAEAWLKLAGRDDLMYAAYNDTVSYGQLICVEDRIVVREYLQDLQDPSQDINKQKSGLEPLRSWIDVAGFIDEDDLADEEDIGTLWIFESSNNSQ